MADDAMWTGQKGEKMGSWPNRLLWARRSSTKKGMLMTYRLMTLMMMTFMIFIAGLFQAHACAARTITDLMNAAAKQPGMKVTELAVKESRLNKQAVSDSLYPKVALFEKGEIYNSPTNLRPMAPTEVNVSAGESIPFSRKILRSGFQLEMPIYAARIYALRNKMAVLVKKAEVENKINLVTRLARVVSINSSFQYLANLEKAVSARIKSLEKTKSDVKLKVENGRSSEAELIKIDNLLIGLSRQKNDLQLETVSVRQKLAQFTKTQVLLPVGMKMVSNIKKTDFIGIQKSELQVAAAQKEEALSHTAHYPVVSLYGDMSRNDGEAYNTGDGIHRYYHSAGISVTFPLYDKTLATRDTIASIQLEKARKTLADTRIELNTLSRKLQKQLPIVKKSLALAGKSLKNSEQLLKIARISFDIGRTTTEDYLDYESRVLTAQASVYDAINQKWQIIAQQAILYGTDLRALIK